ncbi:MAG: hemerythrin domain-containing protein [Acidobacteria bacterium]|nr:hemerythrin domain-containing protein [Acidobacteriota bacterium]
MTAIELLKNDHREVLSMIEQLENTGEGATASSRIEVFNKLKGALTLHTKLEEQFFYPALENFDETRNLIKESYKEHREVDELLTKMSGQSDDWEDQLSELKSTSSTTWTKKRTKCFRRLRSCSARDGFRR